MPVWAGSTWRYANADSTDLITAQCVDASNDIIDVPQQDNQQAYRYHNMQVGILIPGNPPAIAANWLMGISTSVNFIFDKPKPGEASKPDSAFVGYALHGISTQFVNGEPVPFLFVPYGPDTLRRYPSYSLRGKTYHDVYTFKFNASRHLPDNEPWVVFTKKEGVIRFYDQERAAFYDLVDYHLVQ